MNLSTRNASIKIHFVGLLWHHVLFYLTRLLKCQDRCHLIAVLHFVDNINIHYVTKSSVTLPHVEAVAPGNKCIE